MNNQGSGGSIPPPPPRNNNINNSSNNKTNNSHNNKPNNNHGNFPGRGGRGRGFNHRHHHGGGGGRGRHGPGGGGGRGVGGPMRNNSHHLNHRYGPGGPGEGGAVGMPPPPPPPSNNNNNNNNRNWHGGGRGRIGNNFRGGGRGAGGGPMGAINMGRGRGGAGGANHFHHHSPQHFQQGPPMQGGTAAGGGHGPPFQQHQQPGFVPPPPPSNLGVGPSQMHNHNPMMRNGPPPPPPPPGQQQQQQHNLHRQPQMGIGIPPPPPIQYNNNRMNLIPQMHHAQQQAHFTQPQQQFGQQQLQMQQPFPGAQQHQQHFAQPSMQQTPGATALNNQQQPHHQMHNFLHPQLQQQQTQQHLYSMQQTPSTQPQHQQVYNTLQQQTVPALATATTTAAASAITASTQQLADPEQIASNWSTHQAPSGTNYYYNNVTKKSTYVQPPCLSQTNNSISTISSSNIITAATSTTTSNQKQTSGWTQHIDKASGKIYYYNGKTTTWDKPPDFIDSSSSSSSTTTTGFKRKDHSSTITSSLSPPQQQQAKKKWKKDNDKTSTYSSKAEAIAAFKGLLLAKDISPTTKWNDVLKLCSSDSRWNACNSIGERKQALTEYQTKRAAELREQKRQEKVRAKDAFMSLLTDVLPSVRAFNTSARFEDIRDSLLTDGRFHAVEDEDTRHELYLDFVKELRKRDERQRRGRKREAKDSFLAFLKSREEIGSLTFASTWSAFLLTLSDKDKDDPRFKTSTGMSDSDRQLYFADFVIELNAAEEEKKRRIQDARRRAEKAQRSAYRETLRSMAKEGKILPSSRWRNCEEDLCAHKSFGPVNDQDKNAPRDMFEDFVLDWADDYRRDKNFIINLIDSSKDPIEIEIDSEYDSFKEALLKAAAYSPDAYSDARRVINDDDPVSSAKLYFDEMILRAKSGSAMLPKRRGRRANDSSEDEGEIVEDEEDGEIVESANAQPDDTASSSLTREDDSRAKELNGPATKKKGGIINEDETSKSKFKQEESLSFVKVEGQKPLGESITKQEGHEAKSQVKAETHVDTATPKEEESNKEGKPSSASIKQEVESTT